MSDLGEDREFDAVLAAARADAMRPAPAALLARIAGDAEAELAWQRARTPARGGLRGLLAGLGGWPGIGGLVTAAAVGVWIGVVQPTTVEDLGLPVAGAADDDALAMLLPDYSLATDWEG